MSRAAVLLALLLASMLLPALHASSGVDGVKGVVEIDCPPRIVVWVSSEEKAREIGRELSNVVWISIDRVRGGYEATYVIGSCSVIDLSNLLRAGVEIEEVHRSCACVSYRVVGSRIVMSLSMSGVAASLSVFASMFVANLVLTHIISSRSRSRAHVSLALMVVFLATFLALILVAVLGGLVGCVVYPLVTALAESGLVKLLVPLTVIAFVVCGLGVASPSLVVGVRAAQQARREALARIPRRGLERLRAIVLLLFLVPALAYLAPFLVLVFAAHLHPALAVLASALVSALAYEAAVAFVRARLCRFEKLCGTDVCVLDAWGGLAMQVGLIQRTIVVSRDVVHVLREDELCAVVAHERAHARGLHTLILELAGLVPVSVIGYSITEVVSSVRSVEAQTILITLLSVLCILAPAALQIAVGRVLESRADRRAATLVGAKPLARALVKLTYLARGALRDPDLAEKIVEKLLDTHQPLRRRISVLSRGEVEEALDEARRLLEELRQRELVSAHRDHDRREGDERA